MIRFWVGFPASGTMAESGNAQRMTKNETLGNRMFIWSRTGAHVFRFVLVLVLENKGEIRGRERMNEFQSVTSTPKFKFRYVLE